MPRQNQASIRHDESDPPPPYHAGTHWSAPWANLTDSTGNTWFIKSDDQPNSDLFKFSTHVDVPSSINTNTSGDRHSKFKAATVHNSQSESPEEQEDQEVINQNIFLHDNYNLNRFRIIPDGNCLYRSISQALCRDQSHHMDLRREVVRFMRKNLNRFNPLIEGNPADYLREALIENSWGGYLEILAMTELYDINIIIVLGGTGETHPVSLTCHHFSGEIQPKETVWLSWLSSGHYDLIVDYPPNNREYNDWINQHQDQSRSDHEIAMQLANEDLDEEHQHTRQTLDDTRLQCEKDHQMALRLQEEYNQS